MNRPDDNDPGPDLELQHQLGSLLGDEPPMTSMPGDDLHRGRRLVRRRRWGAAGTAAVLVPALAVGVAAASNGLFTGSSSGGPEQILPADGTTDDVTMCASASAASPAVVPGAEPNLSVAPTPDTAAATKVEGMASSGGQQDANGMPSDLTISVGSADPNGSVTCVAGDGAVSSDCAPDDKECYTFPSDPQEEATMNRLNQLLTGLDPEATHTNGASVGASSSGAMAAGGGTGGADQSLQQMMLANSWADGDREGSVSLSVFASADKDLVDGCSDSSMGTGPDVTCEDRTLADGTKVQIGHGEKNGAHRLTVSYQRDDGRVVIATADQATSEWWQNGQGAAPLDHLPASVEQLTDLVTAPGAHL